MRHKLFSVAGKFLKSFSKTSQREVFEGSGTNNSARPLADVSPQTFTRAEKRSWWRVLVAAQNSGTVVTLTSLSHAFFGSYYSYIICCLLASNCTTKWRHHFYFSQACVYLFSGLSVHLWHPTYRNMDCIKSWLLKADLSSPENQLARYIISNLNWGQMGEVCRNRVLFCTAWYCLWVKVNLNSLHCKSFCGNYCEVPLNIQ